MKKRLLMLCCLVPAVVFGQVKLSDDFKISTGTPYKVVDAADKQYFPDGKGNSISVKTQDEKITIQRYDVETMREINRNEYVDLPKDSKVEKILKAGDRMFYFYSTPTKAKTSTLNVREISLADGTLKAPKTLFESKGEVSPNAPIGNPFAVGGYGGFYGNVGLFEVIESADHSKILIRYRRKPLVKNDDISYDMLGFYSFNVNLEKQWGDEYKMPYTEKVMNNLSYAIGNDGTAYMLAFVTDAKEFELLTLKGGAPIKTTRLSMDAALYFQEIKMHENVEGNLVCTGYYANGMEFKVSWTGNMAAVMNINGILRFKMTTAGVILETHKYDFPIALINQFESQRSKAKNTDREGDGKAGINDLKIVAIEKEADGSTLIVGEQSFVRTEYLGTSTKTVFYYADMIVTKVDKNGKLLWMIKLPKTQYSLKGRAGNGVKFVKGEGCSYLIFLDNKKNAAITKDAVPAVYSDGAPGYLIAYKIDDVTGSYERHTVLDIDNVNGIELYQFATSRIFDISKKIFMIEIYMKGKEDTMIKMQLKK